MSDEEPVTWLATITAVHMEACNWDDYTALMRFLPGVTVKAFDGNYSQKTSTWRYFSIDTGDGFVHVEPGEWVAKVDGRIVVFPDSEVQEALARG